MEKDKFLALLDRYLKGEATVEEQEFIDKFFASYESKSSSLELPDDQDLLWEELRHSTGSVGRNVMKIHTGKAKQRSKGWFKPMAIAASLVLIIAVTGILIYLPEQGNDGWTVMNTPAGQRREIHLPDGTVVHLNAESSLSYPESFSNAIREVKLTGEAFFEVTKDATKPFLVQTENVRTTVLGTSFNVQAYPAEDVVVTVATGKVAVSVADAAENNQREEGTAAVLTQGLQATYSMNTKEMRTGTVNPEIYTDWKNNIIRFQNTTLDEAAKTLSKWYGVAIAFEDDTIKHCRISGRFKDPQLKDVLESIGYMYPVQYKITATNNVLLYGKGC